MFCACIGFCLFIFTFPISFHINIVTFSKNSMESAKKC